jgi:uncharacterized membrane-anchored protein
MMLLDTLAARIPDALKTRGGALALVAALQLGVLGWMVADRVRLLKTGREIVLPIVPVDPRDLFKGDYVRLGYPVSTLPAATLGDIKFKQDAVVYVTIEPQGDGDWKVAAVGTRYPTSVGATQAVLRGRIDAFGFNPNVSQRARYGLERYYVPEGKGLALEKLAREKKLAAIVAVDSAGNAAIKGLSSNGQKIYDEPLF